MRLTSVAFAALAAASLTVQHHANACGGCFAPPTPPSSSAPPPLVTSHRMALSISTEQTVLWDQIRYAGEPSEFAWVLPVKPGARIEVASDAWFDVLDAATAPLVTPPELDCSAAESSCSSAPVAMVPSMAASVGMGCGDAGGESQLVLPDVDGVDVVSHGSAGPYETVILHGDEPGALTNWLDAHGYAVEDDIAPLIESYVEEGFDFVALRMAPGAGIAQMRPVRVIQPGAVPVLPLRMVAAGSAAKTALSLFVVAEARYTPSNFPEFAIDKARLRFDFSDQTSNYGALRDEVFDLGGGRAWLSSFSRPAGFFKTFPSPSTGFPMLFRTSDGLSYTTIADAFIHQGFQNGETTSTDCAAAFRGLEYDVRRVVHPCDEDGECREIDATNEIDARTLACAPPIGSDIPFDDLSVALLGQHPRDVWITRLDANLARASLDVDLELAPAPLQKERSAFIMAQLIEGAGEDCEIADAVAPTSKPSNRDAARLGVAFTLALTALAIALRRLSKLWPRLSARPGAEAQS